MKIMFTEDRVLQDEHVKTPQETKYKRGETIECNAASARHWMSRGVAVDVSDMKAQDIKHVAAKIPAAGDPAEAGQG